MAKNNSPAWYDAMYNNRALVPAFAQHMADWRARSRAARGAPGVFLDQAYGAAAAETLDVFCPARSDAPVLVFIHGGYWRALDKADHSFVASAFTCAGAVVVVPNYSLCPGPPGQAVSLLTITLQMVQAVAWTWRHIGKFGGDPQRITVVGHSAGGHLAAMLLACLWQRHAADLPADVVRNALAISGLYELESIRRTPFLQADLRLTPEQVLLASPAGFAPPERGELLTVAGGLESAEFLRQNQLMRAAWGRARVPGCEVLPGLNHFSVLESLADPQCRLHLLALDLLGLC